MSEVQAYFNEHDRRTAEWLRNLIKAGLLPAGEIDARDIQEVAPDDVRGYRECHFFAGIGGWPLALRLAGWPPARPVWTGSPPCQPYSQAGKGLGDEDSRNLWPYFRSLIAECQPPTVFGEQVASDAGREWLAGVRADLEDLGYAVGAADLCAAGAGEEAEGLLVRGDQGRWERIVLGPPQIRQRLFWVAHPRRQALRGEGRGEDGAAPRGVQAADGERERVRPDARPGRRRVVFRFREDDGEDVDKLRRQGSWGPREDGVAEIVASARRMAGAGQQSSRQSRPGEGPDPDGSPGQAQTDDEPERRGAARSWSRYDIIPCLDGKARRVESGAQCLVDGVSFRLADGRTLQDISRRALLKGFGNAIVPEAAAVFIRAFMEAP